MNLVRRTKSSASIDYSDDCAYAGRISWRALQTDAQTGFGGHVMIELGRISILAHDQIEASVVIVVTECRAPALALDLATR